MAFGSNLEGALAGATLGLALFIAVETGFTYLWIRPYLAATPSGRSAAPEGGAKPSDKSEADRVAENAAILREAASLAISTQGIVLGLVTFSSAGDLTTTAKVGTSSLVFGVLMGMVVYFLVAYGIGDARRRAASAYLFGLTLWAFGYGLICIGVWLWQLKNAPTLRSRSTT